MTVALRVAMVTPRYHPLTGGVETHVYEVAKRLALEGLDVTVITTDSTGMLPEREAREGFAVRRYRTWAAFGDLRVAPGLCQGLADGAWDLVHVQGIHTMVAPLAMRTALRLELPYVVTFHTGGHNSRLRNAVRPLQWRMLRTPLRRSAGMVAVSEFEADLFAHILRVPKKDIAVIRNGFEVSGESDDVPPEFGVAPVILSAGRLERFKGHHRAMGAMAEVWKRYPDAQLFIAGQGSDEARLRRLAHSTERRNQVHLVSYGPEQRSDFRRLLSRAQLVVLLSNYEAHPVSVMEALGLGKRVLVADTTGLRELGALGWVGVVSLRSSDGRIGAAMVDMLGGPAPRKPAGLQTWDGCAEQLINLYGEVSSQRGAVAR
jgi:glycosyltransferase involved in cell wall biosynthesis